MSTHVKAAETYLAPTLPPPTHLPSIVKETIEKYPAPALLLSTASSSNEKELSKEIDLLRKGVLQKEAELASKISEKENRAKQKQQDGKAKTEKKKQHEEKEAKDTTTTVSPSLVGYTSSSASHSSVFCVFDAWSEHLRLHRNRQLRLPVAQRMKLYFIQPSGTLSVHVNMDSKRYVMLLRPPQSLVETRLNMTGGHYHLFKITNENQIVRKTSYDPFAADGLLLHLWTTNGEMNLDYLNKIGFDFSDYKLSSHPSPDIPWVWYPIEPQPASIAPHIIDNAFIKYMIDRITNYVHGICANTTYHSVLINPQLQHVTVIYDQALTTVNAMDSLLKEATRDRDRFNHDYRLYPLNFDRLHHAVEKPVGKGLIYLIDVSLNGAPLCVSRRILAVVYQSLFLLPRGDWVETVHNHTYSPLRSESTISLLPTPITTTTTTAVNTTTTSSSLSRLAKTSSATIPQPPTATTTSSKTGENDATPLMYEDAHPAPTTPSGQRTRLRITTDEERKQVRATPIIHASAGNTTPSRPASSTAANTTTLTTAKPSSSSSSTSSLSIGAVSSTGPSLSSSSSTTTETPSTTRNTTETSSSKKKKTTIVTLKKAQDSIRRVIVEFYTVHYLRVCIEKTSVPHTFNALEELVRSNPELFEEHIEAFGNTSIGKPRLETKWYEVKEIVNRFAQRCIEDIKNIFTYVMHCMKIDANQNNYDNTAFKDIPPILMNKIRVRLPSKVDALQTAKESTLDIFKALTSSSGTSDNSDIDTEEFKPTNTSSSNPTHTTTTTNNTISSVTKPAKRNRQQEGEETKEKQPKKHKPLLNSYVKN